MTNIFLDLFNQQKHSEKCVRFRSFSGPHFSAFGLNNSEYGHFSRNACYVKQETDFLYFAWLACRLVHCQHKNVFHLEKVNIFAASLPLICFC